MNEYSESDPLRMPLPRPAIWAREAATSLIRQVQRRNGFRLEQIPSPLWQALLATTAWEISTNRTSLEELEKTVEAALRALLLPPERIPDTPPVKITPSYTKKPIAPLPEFFCLHFIGGPKSGTEEFWEYKKNYDKITPEGTLSLAISESLSPTISEKGEITLPAVQHCVYKTTFIPMDQTPFSDAQIVICLLQG